MGLSSAKASSWDEAELVTTRYFFSSASRSIIPPFSFCWRKSSCIAACIFFTSSVMVYFSGSAASDIGGGACRRSDRLNSPIFSLNKTNKKTHKHRKRTDKPDRLLQSHRLLHWTFEPRPLYHCGLPAWLWCICPDNVCGRNVDTRSSWRHRPPGCCWDRWCISPLEHSSPWGTPAPSRWARTWLDSRCTPRTWPSCRTTAPWQHSPPDPGGSSPPDQGGHWGSLARDGVSLG